MKTLPPIDAEALAIARTPTQVAAPKTAIKALNTKAMLVKLTGSKPALSKRDKQAEEFVQNKLDDKSLSVLSKLFHGKDNPVRKLINSAGEIYSYHITHTLPWMDRGPRLLPITAYESYSKALREMTRDLESATAKLLPQYDDHVQRDIEARGQRALLVDYPSREAFKNSLSFVFFFSPLPDASHFLFDVNEEDRQALTEQVESAGKAAQDDMAARLRAPLEHIIQKLRTKIGATGSIFCKSSFENIVEAAQLVESLAMGDERILEATAEIRKAVRPYVLNHEVLRESPVQRKRAAETLENVVGRLAFLSPDLEA